MASAHATHACFQLVCKRCNNSGIPVSSNFFNTTRRIALLYYGHLLILDSFCVKRFIAIKRSSTRDCLNGASITIRNLITSDANSTHMYIYAMRQLFKYSYFSCNSEVCCLLNIERERCRAMTAEICFVLEYHLIMHNIYTLLRYRSVVYTDLVC
jgi:hypothetical protein